MARISFLREAWFSLKILVFTGSALASLTVSGAEYPRLNSSQLDWLGQQIFTNECKGSVDCLTAWNAGEAFPSLGIGHFIWYRAGQEDIYEESFPMLMKFLEAGGLSIPGWIIEENYESPWKNREAFMADFDSDRMQQLRSFLNEHTSEQTAFIIHRFETAVTAIAEAGVSEEGLKTRLSQNFYAVANSSPPLGLYALIDYVNFKGTGVNPSERYRGRGWGLQQVLLAMDPQTDPLSAFVTAARGILEQRVENAPAARNEARWLAGWFNRLNTYLPEPPKQSDR